MCSKESRGFKNYKFSSVIAALDFFRLTHTGILWNEATETQLTIYFPILFVLGKPLFNLFYILIMASFFWFKIG